ncbi:Germinal-center associated nuclear protein [Holothuria leucospilota]|uniref:Germinal-center associated nuclear protein n=1 Tax=Holothuria leucospilota TaxID=206669 RepID=A0A9Q1H7Y2_HOLLE|nr:Germinal-center associated nuclear protein [Holothuria leucospilota]
MIKEYSRPAAGKDSTRKVTYDPSCAFSQVVEYMISELVIRRDLPWYKIYQFVFDRLRAVRQDLVIQQASCQESVTILEHAVRFHIYAGHSPQKSAKWLLFDSTVDAVEFCKQSGLEATIDGIRFQRGSLKLEWKQWPNKMSYQLVERKLPQEFSISAIIRGSASQADYVERSERMPKR